MSNTAYVVTAYRWGQRNAHSFVVGAFDNLDAAKKCADEYSDYRGGKYACEVCAAGAWTESDEAGCIPRQVYYVESAYYGSCGDAGHFHPADANKDAIACPAPVTVRELQNKAFLAELQRDKALKDSARMDWLDSMPFNKMEYADEMCAVVINQRHYNGENYPSVRAAIDAVFSKISP
jgi:hypothetical protein